MKKLKGNDKTIVLQKNKFKFSDELIIKDFKKYHNFH